MSSHDLHNFQDAKCETNEECALVDKKEVTFEKVSEYKGDTESYENSIHEWNNQDTDLQASENLLKLKVKSLEKKETEYKAKVADYEVVFGEMQSAIDSLHTDLNLIDELKKEVDEKKKKITSLEGNLISQKKQAEEKAIEYEQFTVKLHENHEDEIRNVQTEIFNKLEEKDKEIKDVIAMKDSEIEQLRNDNNNKIKSLIDSYEGKLSVAQEEKISALMDQQHRFSTNQDLLRQKYEYSQRQYETEISCLQDQIKSMQKPLPLPGNRRSAPKQTVIGKPLFKKAKNF